MVEEAEGRAITNLHLFDHLKALIDALYRGRFMLEAAELDDVVKNAAMPMMGGDGAGDHSLVTTTGNKRKFALCSPLNAAKRARVILVGGRDDGEGAGRRLGGAGGPGGTITCGSQSRCC
ncbi:hypothetical protein PR202_gb14266 [Eleusine coracana subsp. coracana]|uniref:Uncharacterized protein n=1 Tax=Eleusine coracana subsp. coracana TaxID=191504 RepID=A0AAV5EW80_ELECO|nr:hypothetical protein PR202_gb14266 [Eleusine coracana subsp. coracana]